MKKIKPKNHTQPLFFKKKLFIVLFTLVSFFTFSESTFAQNNDLREQLDKVSQEELSALNKTVSVSVSNVNLGELMRLIALETEVNIYLPQQLSTQISSNFAGAKVKDIIYYLCEEYSLSLDIVGNIVRLIPMPQPIIEEVQPEIIYNKSLKTISYNLQDASLEKVAGKITDLTGVNIVPSPMLRTIKCNGYGKDIMLEDALRQLGFGNNFDIRKISDNQIILLPIQTKKSIEESNSDFYPSINTEQRAFKKNDRGRIDQMLSNTDLEDAFKSLMETFGLSYKMLSPISGVVNVAFKDSSLEDCLYRIFKGTEFSYRIEKGICLVGLRDNNNLKDCRVVELVYRSAESLNKNLPQSYLSGIEWMEFIDNNSIILYGDSDRLYEFQNFIQSLDKRVPLVLIDVIIAEVSKDMSLDIMLDMGIGKAPVSTVGSISPGINMTLGSSSINNALDKVGLRNIGQVTPNFYAKIKALETDGIINIRSTPRLSTLNAKEATMSIGRTEYYLEETNSYIGSLDPFLSTQKMYKSVTAEMSIKLRPIISGDGSITLSIEVNQEDFTDRIDKFAPPGIRSRKFQSEIRVLNNEMVLLGGLEEVSSVQSNSGIPFLARIPVIKWFFSSSSKTKKDYQLSVFIRPTIIN